jgi:uncharacterized protein
MRIGISGASGFIGRHLVQAAGGAGHTVVAFSRQAQAQPGVAEVRSWTGAHLNVNGLDAVVNLAGESVLGLWTAAKRRAIRESRVERAHHLVAALAAEPEATRPRTLVSASAIGWYGDCGETPLSEDEPAGTGFLADVTREWETAVRQAERLGVRVVLLRIGLVLGRTGGGWPLLRNVFRCGLGGRLGSGQQWTPWVHVDDVVGLALHALHTPGATGPINATGAEPVTNADFTQALARGLRRPAVFPVPSFVLRGLLRDQASMFLASQRCLPTGATALGYTPRFPTIDLAVADLVRH